MAFLANLETIVTLGEGEWGIVPRNPRRKIFFKNSFDKEKNAEEFAQAHNTECDFYEIFRGKFLPMPEIYHTQKIIPGIFNHGIILLDDLSEEIAIMEVSDSLNEKQVRKKFLGTTKD